MRRHQRVSTFSLLVILVVVGVGGGGGGVSVKSWALLMLCWFDVHSNSAHNRSFISLLGASCLCFSSFLFFSFTDAMSETTVTSHQQSIIKTFFPFPFMRPFTLPPSTVLPALPNTSSPLPNPPLLSLSLSLSHIHTHSPLPSQILIYTDAHTQTPTHPPIFALSL